MPRPLQGTAAITIDAILELSRYGPSGSPYTQPAHAHMFQLDLHSVGVRRS